MREGTGMIDTIGKNEMSGGISYAELSKVGLEKDEKKTTDNTLTQISDILNISDEAMAERESGTNAKFDMNGATAYDDNGVVTEGNIIPLHLLKEKKEGVGDYIKRVIKEMIMDQATITIHKIEGALAGAGIGFCADGIGAPIGAILGGTMGTIGGCIEAYSKDSSKEKQNLFIGGYPR